ncbi:MAG TPA: SRPBCC family protein [Gemmataceae bacterium]|nr:SRPBCC family protein [Gemmataceae bacterium]
MARNHEPVAEREIVITREFDAPRELVWAAWTDPNHVAQWWGPRGFTTRVSELELRPGGKWRYVMCGPHGDEYPCHGVFREVVPFERIVTTDEFGEGLEKVVPVELPQGPMTTTASFEEVGGKTRLTLRIEHPTAEDRRKHEAMGVVGGWGSSFECLDEHLAKLVAERR